MISLILVYLLIGTVLAVVFASFIAKIGSRKQIGGVSAFALSLFLGPLLGLIIVLASEDLKDGEREPLEASDAAPVVAWFLVLVFGLFFFFKGEADKAIEYSQGQYFGQVDQREKGVNLEEATPEELMSVEIDITDSDLTSGSIKALVESGRWEDRGGEYFDVKENLTYFVDSNGEITGSIRRSED